MFRHLASVAPEDQARTRRAVDDPFRARVEKGRLVLNEPTTLPEGTVVDLVADDEGDDLTDERRALHEALSASWKSAEAGRLRPASAILDELRQQRWSFWLDGLAGIRRFLAPSSFSSFQS
jgi:hypothetical protein